MTVAGSIALLSGAILLVLALRVIAVIRREGSRPMRGSPPGQGHHVIDASYHSGGGGGGHDATFTVPRDPQAYARAFVPKVASERDRT